jgi:hypothetical protein
VPPPAAAEPNSVLFSNARSSSLILKSGGNQKYTPSGVTSEAEKVYHNPLSCCVG